MKTKINIIILCLLWYVVGYWSSMLNIPFKKMYRGSVLIGNILITEHKLPEFLPYRISMITRIDDYFILED